MQRIFDLIRLPLMAAMITLPLMSIASNLPKDDSGNWYTEWDLEQLFSGETEWEQHLGKLRPAIHALADFESVLRDDSSRLAEYLDQRDQILIELRRVMTWASLQVSVDQRDAQARERAARARNLYADIRRAVSWYRPLILEWGETRVRQLLADDPRLAPWNRELDRTLLAGPHTHPADTEAVLALTAPLARATSPAYNIFVNADLPWPAVTLSTGEEVTLNQTAFQSYRQLSNRDDRRKVFETFWGALRQYESTIGELYYLNVQTEVVDSKVRNHSSSLNQALFDDDLPEAVYRNLLDQAREALPSLHRYMQLRARMLGLDRLAYWDVYNPLVELDTTYDLDRSVRLLLEAALPLGDDYMSDLSSGLEGPFMHVYPAPGKSSGAFMSGSVIDAHPYVFLNHTDDLRSATTLAHEWGHAIHSVLSNRHQPFPTARYSLFIAEIAAFTNEYLLLDHLQRTATSAEERLKYLVEELEHNRGAFFRQTKFAEFEYQAHKAVENDEPLSGSRLSRLYGDLLRQYYGHDVGVTDIDEVHFIEWAMIPHFYNNFYVYNYATSTVAANYFARAILSGDQAVRARYLQLLRSGSAKDPYTLVLETGLDMKKPHAYRALEERMQEIMDEIEEILQ